MDWGKSVYVFWKSLHASGGGLHIVQGKGVCVYLGDWHVFREICMCLCIWGIGMCWGGWVCLSVFRFRLCRGNRMRFGDMCVWRAVWVGGLTYCELHVFWGLSQEESVCVWGICYVLGICGFSAALFGGLHVWGIFLPPIVPIQGWSDPQPHPPLSPSTPPGAFWGPQSELGSPRMER